MTTNGEPQVERYEGGTEPVPGELWEESDGCMLLRVFGGWWAFGVPVPDNSPVLAYPVRRRFDVQGHDVNPGTRLRYRVGGHNGGVVVEP